MIKIILKNGTPENYTNSPETGIVWYFSTPDMQME